MACECDEYFENLRGTSASIKLDVFFCVRISTGVSGNHRWISGTKTPGGRKRNNKAQ